MRFIVQVRIESDTNTQSDVIDIAVIERDVLSPAPLGLTVEEAEGSPRWCAACRRYRALRRSPRNG